MNNQFELDWTQFKNIINTGSSFKEIDADIYYTLIIVDSGIMYKCVLDKGINSSETIEYETDYQSLASPITFNSTVIIEETPPFAKPDYRTKRDGSPTWTNVNENATANSDYQLTEERYVSGGECIVIGAKKGDWISAEVVDANSIIPEAYRATLCENWPVVAEYVVRANLVPSENAKEYILNTYPLNAKITPGLVLRIVYHSSAEVGVRSFCSNYYLTKKL